MKRIGLTVSAVVWLICANAYAASQKEAIDALFVHSAGQMIYALATRCQGSERTALATMRLNLRKMEQLGFRRLNEYRSATGKRPYSPGELESILQNTLSHALQLKDGETVEERFQALIIQQGCKKLQIPSQESETLRVLWQRKMSEVELAAFIRRMRPNKPN